MSFEKPPVFNPTKIEYPPLTIPKRFDLNNDPEIQEGLREALAGCQELIKAEKYSTGRLPNLELRYRENILKYLLRYGAIELEDLHECLEEEYITVKDTAYQKALELVYRLNGSIGSGSSGEAKKEGKVESEDDDWSNQ